MFTLTDQGREEVANREVLEGTLVERCPFHVHVAPIASGNAVEADGTIWGKLERTLGARKALGVEMEAAAVGSLAHGKTLPFVVAKGVMDNADSHKTDRYKAFAARASATVLLAFLQRVRLP